ncbi:MAG: Spy/CpxP family protein refolding chaperone [Moraxellaceae bacterium]|nr:Spy/CpxP family protein refolding chaperone [Moraxellaceae bacterium]
MKHNTIVRRFLLASAVALALPVAAQAQGGPERHGEFQHAAMRDHMSAGEHGGRGMRGHGEMKGMRGIKLSDAQKKQMRELHDRQSDAARPKQRALREDRIALEQLTRGEQYDAKRAAELTSKIGNLQGDLLLQRIESRRAFLAVLTPDQRTQLQKNMEQRREHRRDGAPARRGEERGPQGGPPPRV